MVDAHEPSPTWPLSGVGPLGDGVDGHDDVARGSGAGGRGGGSYWDAGEASVRDPPTNAMSGSDRNKKNSTAEGEFMRQPLASAPAWGGDGGDRRGLVAAAFATSASAAGTAATAAATVPTAAPTAAPREWRQFRQPVASAGLAAAVEAAREPGTGGGGAREDRGGVSTASRVHAGRVGGGWEWGDADDGRAKRADGGGEGRLRGLTSKASLD